MNEPNNIAATVFVYCHKVTGDVVAHYTDAARIRQASPEWELVASLEPRAWIQANWHQAGQVEDERNRFESWFTGEYPNTSDRQGKFRMSSVRDLMASAFSAGARLPQPASEGWSPVFALAPNGYLWFALDCGHVVRGVKSGEHFNWSDDAENGDHECCDSAIAVAWMAIAIPDHPSANKCKRKTGLNGEPCGLTPPCPDCGLSCHDVAEGG